MSYELAIWKWRYKWPRSRPSRVYAAISEDRPHWSLSRFDMHGLRRELEKRFGITSDLDPNAESAPFLTTFGDFAGYRANWLFVEGMPTDERIIQQLLEVLERYNLSLYDPQVDEMIIP